METDAERGEQTIAELALLGLSVAAGGVDAATYLGLGHAFPANMTGNTVLIAIAAARGDWADGLRSVVVLAGYGVGVVVAAALLDRRSGRRSLCAALLVECVLLLGVLIVRAAADAPSDALRDVLLTLAGLAMGMQSAVTRGLSIGGGIATTYITGTLTGALARLADRMVRGRESSRSRTLRELATGVWFVYGLGALVGALLEVSAGAVAFVPSTALVAAVALGLMLAGD